MLNSMIPSSSSSQQQQQEDSFTSDTDNVALMEALLYSYINQEQQLTSPLLSISTTRSTTGFVTDIDNTNSTASPCDYSFELSNDLFQSPQLPFQQQKQQQQKQQGQQQFYPPLASQHNAQTTEAWDNNPLLDILQTTATLGSMNDIYFDSSKINLQLNSFTDLKNALHHLQNDPSSLQQKKQQTTKKRKNYYGLSTLTMEQQQQASATASIPVVVRDTVESTSFLASLMDKARRHWCCVGFKVAPVTLDIIQDWQQAPVTIIYCVASIVLVTFMDHSAGQAYVKTAAMEFYEQARRKMDDIVFDDENDCSNYHQEDDGTGHRQKAMTIQSYFCLSYTSNLLRLYEQQRTWGGLASIALQLRTNDAETGCRPMDKAILLCWCRWYYVDAWMSLTLQRECLLPDTPPQFIFDIIQQQSTFSMGNQVTSHEHHSLYQFAILTKFMRRYIRIIQADKLMDPVTMNPSPEYYRLTDELKQWYDSVQQQQTTKKMGPAVPLEEGEGPDSNVHLHLCYHAMCLVIIYRFLHPDNTEPSEAILMDGLETNLALLQALQQLSAQGCDQSTYHQMFFAIHNTASRIYQHHTKNRNSKWQKWAKQQLQMNLVLLKGTPAYANDVFQMRTYAEKIERQFLHIGLHLSAYYQSTLTAMEQWILQKQQPEMAIQNMLNQSSPTFVPTFASALKVSSSRLPGTHVYKLHTAATIKKPRKPSRR